MLTTGFIRPPLRCPIVIANVAMLRPAVMETCSTKSELLYRFNCDPQTRKTNIVVAKNSPATQIQNLRFRSSVVSGMIDLLIPVDCSASKCLRLHSAHHFCWFLTWFWCMVVKQTVRCDDWLGGNLSFYFCYGDRFLPLTSCFPQKMARSLHIKRLPFSIHLCQLPMFYLLLFVSVTGESIKLCDMTITCMQWCFSKHFTDVQICFWDF